MPLRFLQLCIILLVLYRALSLVLPTNVFLLISDLYLFVLVLHKIYKLLHLGVKMLVFYFPYLSLRLNLLRFLHIQFHYVLPALYFYIQYVNLMFHTLYDVSFADYLIRM
jgi:hypothetical protein